MRCAPPPATTAAPWRHKEQGHCDLASDSPGCGSPDLPCHLGTGASPLADCLDVGDCGCNLVGYSNSQRDKAHLDTLARRTEKRNKRQ